MTGAEITLLLFSAYPVETRNVPGDQALATAKIYERGLQDLADQPLRLAIDILVKTSTRLPTVARIREVVLEIQHGPARPGGDAWGDVLRTMQQFGSRTPGLDFTWHDPIVARAVEALGWSTLTRSEDQTADRARFIELYDRLTAAARLRAQAAPGACSTELLAIGAPTGITPHPRLAAPTRAALPPGERVTDAGAARLALERLEAGRCPVCDVTMTGTRQTDLAVLAEPCGHELQDRGWDRAAPMTLGQAVRAYMSGGSR